ncbi:endonuclease MutS2 [Mycoplasma sp. P36-A1]|uniref:endonuclease MutS2 n=1 Tax=Mycoplasma sp. P36-A1 TaxID=3252900 RepID=UPI003C2CFE19
MDKFYDKLEFNDVLKKVSNKAHSNYAKEKILKNNVITDYDIVVNNLHKCDEIMQIITSYGPFSLDGLYDINISVEKAVKEQVLTPDQLIEIASLNQVITNLNNFIKQFDDKDKYKYFVEKIKELINIKDLAMIIERKVAPSGLLYEDASENLVRINKEIDSINHKISNYLTKFIHDNSIHLMDNIVTYRNNRAVVMVKQASKNIIKGIIHDESSSKQTAFVEPNQVVEYNNILQNLEYQKNIEVEIILRELSQKVAEHSEALFFDFDIIIELDIVLAKATYTLEIDGIIPKINKNSAKLEVYEGRHPLIDKNKVVANDFFIANNDTKYRIVLISGSNTGGKTVTLKMIGLFSLMAQSGIGISAKENSSLPIYTDIFVDIGDEQSIESSLSTFSARLNNVIKITENVTRNSLVLFDELGSGTDPREGENLALAVLEYLYQKDASVIITTHYSKLKNWAITSDHVRSASVMFDEKTNKPMYKLSFDTFASSNAFEIALNLGLNAKIIENARKLYSEDLNTSDELLLKLEQTQQETRILKEELNSKIDNYENKVIRIENERKKLDKDVEKIIEQAKLKANDIVANAANKSDRIIKELKKQDSFVNHKVNEITRQFDNLYEKNEVKEVDNNIVYEVGDLVELVSLNRQGTIINVLPRNNYEISIGNIKTKAKKAEIRFVSKNQQKAAERKIKQRRYVSKKVSTEVNLIGLRVEEALRILNKYLDDALLANVKSVRVVHGFGTGALRTGVHEALKKNKNVKNYHFAEYNEGGQGATIVNFK